MDTDDLVQEMRHAAERAARQAAGQVIGDRIGAEHPSLPPLVWGAGGGHQEDPTWHTTGYVATSSDDAETRRIVAVYAKALGGGSPREAEFEGSGWHIETTAMHEGIELTIWGILSDPPARVI